jgi:hypothetical protein
MWGVDHFLGALLVPVTSVCPFFIARKGFTNMKVLIFKVNFNLKEEKNE